MSVELKRVDVNNTKYSTKKAQARPPMTVAISQRLKICMPKIEDRWFL